jgi:hypothetical protein
MSNNTNKRLDVLTGVISFYCLEELKIAEYNHSRAQQLLLQDVTTTQRTMINKMSRTMRDYLVISSAGEARHAMDNSHFYLKNIPIGGSRNESYMTGIQFSLESLREALLNVFNPDVNKWSSAYGGKAWHNIVKASILYDNPIMPKSVFLDHIVDLAHNGGCAFNKNVLLTLTSSADFKAFLDAKCTGSAIKHVMTNSWLKLDFNTYQLLLRARNLLVKKLPVMTSLEQVNTVSLSYPAIGWGLKVMDSTLIEKAEAKPYKPLKVKKTKTPKVELIPNTIIRGDI